MQESPISDLVSNGNMNISMKHVSLLNLPSRVNILSVITVIAFLYTASITVVMGLEISSARAYSVNLWIWLFAGFAIAHAFWAIGHIWFRMQKYDLHPHHLFHLEKSFWVSLFYSMIMVSLVAAFYQRWHNIIMASGTVGVSVIDNFRNNSFWGPYFSLGAQSVTLLGRVQSQWFAIMAVGIALFAPLVIHYATAMMYHIIRHTSTWYKHENKEKKNPTIGSYAYNTQSKRSRRKHVGQ